MDFPNGHIDEEYRGFRIRYAKDAFEAGSTVLDANILALTPEANAAMAYTGGIAPEGWHILRGDSLQAFLANTKAAIDKMLRDFEKSKRPPVTGPA